MALKSILERLKRLEEKQPRAALVTLIRIINGEYKKERMRTTEAAMEVLRQTISPPDPHNRIVGVEDPDEERQDGFIEALLAGAPTTPEEYEELLSVIEE